MYTDVNFILSVGTVPVFSLSRTCAKLCTAVHVFVNLYCLLSIKELHIQCAKHLLCSISNLESLSCPHQPANLKIKKISLHHQKETFSRTICSVHVYTCIRRQTYLGKSKFFSCFSCTNAPAIAPGPEFKYYIYIYKIFTSILI